MFHFLQQKEKAKHFKKEITQYLESLLQSQQQVSVYLIKQDYFNYQIVHLSSLFIYFQMIHMIP